MGQLRAYPKIWHMGHRQAHGIFAMPGPIYVQEKIDGSQISFGLVDGHVELRSKSKVQTPDPDRMFTKALEVVDCMRPNLVPGYTYRGEYLNRPKHNCIAYDRTPKNNIILYDIELPDGTFMEPAKMALAAFHMGFEVVPMLGVMHFAATKNDFDTWLQLESKLGGSTIEGVVLKNYSVRTDFGDPVFVKYVSEAFKEAHKRSAGTLKKGDVIEAIGTKYWSPARFQKAVQHLEEAGELEHEPKDIGLLFKEVARDFEEEWASEVKEDLYLAFRKKIIGRVQHGIAQWYKDKLVSEALDG